MSTRYEAILEHPDKGRFLFLYFGRKSRQALVRWLQTHRDPVVKFTGSDQWKKADIAAGGVEAHNGWVLRFSGRTQKTAQTEGELPFYLHTDTP